MKPKTSTRKTKIADRERGQTVWHVQATRTTLYAVLAASEQEAIDKMIQGEGDEVDGSTERIEGWRECPTCEQPIHSPEDTPDRHDRYPGNYCETCDREITEEELQDAAEE